MQISITEMLQLLKLQIWLTNLQIINMRQSLIPICTVFLFSATFNYFPFSSSLNAFIAFTSASLLRGIKQWISVCEYFITTHHIESCCVRFHLNKPHCICIFVVALLLFRRICNVIWSVAPITLFYCIRLLQRVVLN